jgi:intermediate filament protein if
MRAELEAINRELQELQDTKLSLELEIAAYRKLLEGEENRQGLKNVVDSLFGAFSAAAGAGGIYGDFASIRSVVKGEVQAKITNQRSAKGATSIGDSSVEGKFVTIENTGRKEEEISGWRVTRTLNGSDKPHAEYKFGDYVVLKAGDRFKLWAKGSLPADFVKGVDIETSVENWGFGSETTVTKIENKLGEDRATLIQKTTTQV